MPRGALETLVGILRNFDFAALVLTPEDLLVKRDILYPAPRDNVLLELGLFSPEATEMTLASVAAVASKVVH